MKNFEEICEIIDNMADPDFDKLSTAWYDMILLSGQPRYSARRRFLRICKKYNLTEEEYDRWVD